jgi:glycosyltransferase involved in cell wall biosynthesis
VVLAAEAYVHDWLGTYRECVDLILAPSRFVRQKLVANGWNKSKIEVIPHFQNLPQTAVPFPGRDAHILYFGRLSREKGVSDLLQAMVYLPQVWLVIAGDGPQKQQLQTLAEGLGLRNASFRGHVSGGTLQRLIAESQFTVFPSRAYETFGKSILESYAHGRAVVASDLGSRRELVEEGENGVLYRAGDAKQLAAAIAFLYERPELARQMGEAGHELVRQRYSQEQHFQALTSIYEGLAKQARAKRLAITTQPPLRVAFIGGRGVVGKYSGVERYYEEIGRRLADKGHEITAYCRSHFTPEIATYQGIRIVRLPTIRSKHLDTLVHTLLSTIHSCFGPYDIVHFHTLGPSLFSFVPRAFGKKTIVTVQGLDWQRKKWSPLARNCLKLGEWASARLPNQTIVVSHTLQARYFSRYQKQAAYVPNGTVFLEQRNGPDLEALGLAPGQYVLFLGRFSPEKNCDLLIQAFEHTDTSMALALAGGSAHSDSYAAALRQHASPRIKFTGWLSGEVLDQVLTNAAVFVLPSDMEGLSLALLEAMGAGICVLASDIPENREVIDDAGFTFRAGDPRDLERMLTVLLSDPQIRATAGARARVRVQQHYLWDDIANQTEAIYLNLTHSPQRKEAVSASADTEPVVLRAQGD